MRRVYGFCAGALLAWLSLFAPAAQATFHEMWVREVYAGSSLAPASQYVELQMWASGQNLVGGHVLRTYNADGSVRSTNTFAANVANGANQSTILLGTSAVSSEFSGVVPDTSLAEGAIDPAGGAVCWEDLDCVSWGAFKGPLPSPAGAPAPAIPGGMALRRTIAPFCQTALDGGDDRNDSAGDFSIAFPSPRPNSVAPSEQRCIAAGGSEGGSGGGGNKGAGGQKKGPPQTTLRGKPRKKTRDRTPTFRFGADEPGSSFQCKLDKQRFKGCRSPFTTKQLSFGPHTFQVRARDASGQRDPSPASYGFKVLRRP
ncbi:MAG TPA: hypothetical protein VJQ84_06500 [Solirubrobacterales bacterium]|nr:hypothetical protein [Solirubrobacterales bacterium]